MKTASKKEIIDIVIPWVDGHDPAWNKERNKYSNACENKEGNNAARFRDWDTLKYVLRGIDKYAPWVNKVFLVTCGQKPAWLNEKCDKIRIVDHRDYIPEQYLPTFCANAIELNLFRIKELSDSFVFFNDDIILVNKTHKAAFFKNGLPCDTAVLNTHCGLKSRLIYNIAFNDTCIINEHFEYKNTIKKNLMKWFNYRYGIKNLVQNIILINCPRFPGFKHFHMTNSFKKEAFRKVWELERDELDKTCKGKFRDKNHVNQWLIREYQLASGDFYPSRKYKIGLMVDFEKQGVEKAIKNLKRYVDSRKYKMICVNDGDSIENYDDVKRQVIAILESKFPEKSRYEK